MGPVYACIPCDARVGVHRLTLKPLGRLADANLRALKIEAHEAFDPLWRDLANAYPELPVDCIPYHIHRIARTRAYEWLAREMGITPERCHIGAFDEAQCRRAVAIIERTQMTAERIRELFHEPK